MPIQYQQTNDKEIVDKVRNKRREAIRELKGLNFEEYVFYGETVHALGFDPLGITGFLGAMIALFKEVSKVERNLDVTIFNAVMIFREEAAYASPFGLGVKFYTSFTDGTFLISANFDTTPINDEGKKIYKVARVDSITNTWSSHTSWVERVCAQGRQKMEHLSLADFLYLSNREDEYLANMMNRGW
jgi:hypothetical protein